MISFLIVFVAVVITEQHLLLPIPKHSKSQVQDKQNKYQVEEVKVSRWIIKEVEKKSMDIKH